MTMKKTLLKKARKAKHIAKTGGDYGGAKRRADPALVAAPVVVKAFDKIPRFSIHILFAVALFGLTVWLAPQTGAAASSAQVNVVQTLAYALSRLSLGAAMGYVIWLSVFKNVHIDFTTPRDPVTAKLIESRGLVVAAGMLALVLGG